MFTVSSYYFHPLVQRFVRLWRWSQVVSAGLTSILSTVCCQCCGGMPLSGSESEKSGPVQFVAKPTVDAGRASGEPFRAQHFVIDFTPRPQDIEEGGRKCQLFWDTVNTHPDLKGLMVKPEGDKHNSIEQLSVAPVHKASARSSLAPSLPAVELIEDLEHRGIIGAAFALKESSNIC